MRAPILLVALCLVLPVSAAAQVEIGADAALGITSGEDRESQTLTEIVTRHVRLGFPINNQFVVESMFMFVHESEGGDTRSLLALWPGLTFLLGESGSPRFYLRGQAGIVRNSYKSNGSSDSNVQKGIGGAAGVRIPANDRVFFRIEASLLKVLESDEYYGYTTVGVLVGISAIVG